MKKLGLLGRKIGYSLSPALHAALFRLLLQEGSYELIDVTGEELPAQIQALRRGEWDGLNVTIPYKRAVMPLLDALTPRGRAVGAVNTVYLENGLLTGDNTDVAGFAWQLSKLAQPDLRTAAVLGTGGAARAAVAALNEAGYSRVTLISRAPLERRGFLGAEAMGYDALADLAPELLINATPHGAKLPYETLLADSGALAALDLCYRPCVTELQRVCARRGVPCVNGLGMLCMQAAKAQERFWGKPLPCEKLAEKLMEEMGRDGRISDFGA